MAKKRHHKFKRAKPRHVPLKELREELNRLNSKISGYKKSWDSNREMRMKWGDYGAPYIPHSLELRGADDERTRLKNAINDANNWINNPLSSIRKLNKWEKEKQPSKQTIGFIKSMMTRNLIVDLDYVDELKQIFGAVKKLNANSTGFGSEDVVVFARELDAKTIFVKSFDAPLIRTMYRKFLDEIQG